MKKMMAIFAVLAMLVTVITVGAVAATAGNVENGKTIPFSTWKSVGDGEWTQNDDGVITPSNAQEWTMLSNNKNLGDKYTIEFDVKQPDDNGSYNVKIGFEVNPDHNFTQSGLVLELHNAGVSRIYDWAINSQDEGAYGGCNNGYGGGQGFSKSTDWIHIKIVRNGNDFTVVVNDGEERTFNFSSDKYNGGCLVLGAVNGRAVSYRNISIVTADGDSAITGDNIMGKVIVMMLTGAAMGSMLCLRKKENA